MPLESPPSPWQMSWSPAPHHPVALEPLEHRVLDHPADKRLHLNGFSLGPVCAVGTIVVRHPLAIVAIDAPDRDWWAHHVLGHIARQAVVLCWHLAHWPPSLCDTSGNICPRDTSSHLSPASCATHPSDATATCGATDRRAKTA